MKYLVYVPEWEITKRLFDDLNGKKDVIVYENFFGSHIFDKISKSHMFGKLSWLPLKRIWKYFSNPRGLSDNEKYVFVYIGGPNVNIAAASGFVNYMRKKFFDSKHVAFYLDIHVARKQNVELYKKIFDQMYIFDTKEAQNMGVSCFPIPFSRGITSDIAFVGHAKNRLNDLIRIYDKVHPQGIKCAFYIIGVPKEKQINREGITYGSFLGYDESLSYIINTNCVLELKVEGVYSYSDRVQKAIAYNKKILTNNPSVKENQFYNSELVQIFASVEDIDISFLKQSIYKKIYNYDDEYSPIHFLDRIKTELNIIA